MGAFSPDTNCTLTTDLKAYWKMEEASGTRFDSIGSNDLTDNNTVTQAAGIVGNAGQFTVANLEFLSIADNADLSVADIDYTLSAWVYFDNVSLNHLILSRWNGGGVDREYQLLLAGGGNVLEFQIGDGATNVIGSVGDSTVIGANTWHFVVAWHDSVANTVNIQVNNGSVTSSATTGAAGDGGAEFRMGNVTDGTASMNGRIDEVGFWKRVLTTQERTDLYNSGAGNTFDSGASCPSFSVNQSSMLLLFD